MHVFSNPSQILLKYLLRFFFIIQSFDGCVTEQMVYNGDALATLHDCFYRLPLSDQLWLLDRLLDIVKKYVHNQQKCCQAGLICHLLSLLAQHHNGEQQLTNDSTGTKHRDISLYFPNHK